MITARLSTGFPLSVEQQAWLDKTWAGVEERGEQNPCVRLYGPGPAGARCKTCRLFLRKGGYAKTYFKCELRGDTNGPGTDHRANWPACGRYVPTQQEQTEARP